MATELIDTFKVIKHFNNLILTYIFIIQSTGFKLEILYYKTIIIVILM